MSFIKNTSLFLIISVSVSCSSFNTEQQVLIEISKEKYQDQLEGFWLAQLIANWTGLITENDKIGNIGEIKTGDFYTERTGVKLIKEVFGKMTQLINQILRLIMF